jgi:hypothetical protein
MKNTCAAILYLLVILPDNLLCQKLEHLVFGKYDVGFASFTEKDFGRPSRSENKMGRSIQINVWYPTNGKGSRMFFKDYIDLLASEDSVTAIFNKGAPIFLAQLSARGANVEAWQAFLAGAPPMNSKRNAAFMQGNFPIVLLMHGSAFIHCLMAEFLASNGMIVISTPFKGYLQNAFDVNTTGMETEIRDHEFALSFIAQHFKISPSKIGVAGISFGGQSAIAFAVRNTLVKGVVSLDGGIGSIFGSQLLSAFPFYSIEKVQKPILHLYNPEDRGGNIDWFYTCEFTDRYLIAFKHMEHSFFTIYGMLDNFVEGSIGPTANKAGDNYEAVLSYTLAFFTAIFSDQEMEALRVMQLDERLQWITPCLDSKAFLKKRWSPIPIQDLLETLHKKGVSGLKEKHDSQKPWRGMPITDGSYRLLLTQLFNAGDTLGILDVSQMYETDFPSGAMPKYFRGRALHLNNQIDDAKKFYQQCLELLPSDAAVNFADKVAYTSRCHALLED